MHEGDLQTEHPPPGLGVDQLRAVADEVAENDADILDLVGDVVHPRPVLRQEPAHRGVLPEGREQLDAAPADADGRRFDALLLDMDAMLEPAAEEALVRRHRFVEICDGEPDMVDPARLHEESVSVAEAPNESAPPFLVGIASDALVRRRAAAL